MACTVLHRQVVNFYRNKFSQVPRAPADHLDASTNHGRPGIIILYSSAATRGIQTRSTGVVPFSYRDRLSSRLTVASGYIIHVNALYVTMTERATIAGPTVRFRLTSAGVLIQRRAGRHACPHRRRTSQPYRTTALARPTTMHCDDIVVRRGCSKLAKTHAWTHR